MKMKFFVLDDPQNSCKCSKLSFVGSYKQVLATPRLVLFVEIVIVVADNESGSKRRIKNAKSAIFGKAKLKLDLT